VADADAQANSVRIINYTYDAQGRRVKRAIDVNGGTPTFVNEYFVYDGDELSMTFGDAGQLEHRYLHGPADQVLVDEVFETVGGQQVSNERLWLLGDHQGSPRDIVDDTGVLRKHINYDSFGQKKGEQFYARNGNEIDATHAEAVEQLFYYTGQELDLTTGLYQMGQRWYDPRTGRWLSEDPIGFDGGDPNLYRYVGNGVTYRTDPTGLIQAGNPLNNLFGNTTSIPNFNANLGLSNYYSGQPNLSGGISSYFASAAPSAADFSVFGAGIGTSNFSTLSGGLSSFVGPSQQQIANAQANPSLASPVTRTSYVVRAQTGRTLRPMNGQVAQK
jgi:RHS repeat-associated protein